MIADWLNLNALCARGEDEALGYPDTHRLAMDLRDQNVITITFRYNHQMLRVHESTPRTQRPETSCGTHLTRELWSLDY